MSRSILILVASVSSIFIGFDQTNAGTGTSSSQLSNTMTLPDSINLLDAHNLTLSDGGIMQPSKEPVTSYTALELEPQYTRASITKRRLAIPNFSFEAGDLPNTFGASIPSSSLTEFGGRWRLMNSRSDSINEILTALGISPFKRRLMAKFESVTDITIDEGQQTVKLRTSLPAGRSVTESFDLNGTPTAYQEPETGRWTLRGGFFDGRLAQQFQGKKGEMYDVRVVFKSDPEGILAGPIMLFRWTFVPSGSLLPVIADRWLRLD